ncbi:MAG: rod shape-determining protein MreD [Gammaproteobacteria bacterium]|nr:rod shape-determining protein MreD [Gammaproteobacteria bacterium]
MSRSSSSALAIVSSFAVAGMLTLAPLPEWAVAWRPEWVALTLIYWVLTVPRQVGIGAGWTLGLIMDATQGTLLGAHALGFSVIAYITLRLYPRLRWFPLYQQAIFVGLMLLLYRSATLWINGMQGFAQESWLYWAPVLSSVLLWPCVSVLLQATFRPGSMR